MELTLSKDLPATGYYRYQRTLDHVLKSTVAPENAKQEYGSYQMVEHMTSGGIIVSREEWVPDNKPARETLVRHFIPQTPAPALYHSNYLEYLTQAWAEHHNVVFTPDIMWFGILNEITKAIVADPTPHRDIFTRSEGKVAISVPVGSSTDPLPLDDIMAQMINLVPVDINIFMPRFSTSTDMSRLAHVASFAEAASPYYSYMTFCCGIPKIQIQGTDEDYDLVGSSLSQIYNELDRVNSPLMPWMERGLMRWVEAIVARRRMGDADFFRNIIDVERCGSGGEIAIEGWWSQLFREQPCGERKPMNFPTQIARVPWTNMDTGREFTLNVGLFHSTQQGDFMVPEFGWVQNEVTA